jgi:hypothetical protein
VDRVLIQKLLDHSTSAMTDRYLKPRVEMLHAAIEKLEAHNAKMAAPPSPGVISEDVIH